MILVLHNNLRAQGNEQDVAIWVMDNNVCTIASAEKEEAIRKEKHELVYHRIGSEG